MNLLKALALLKLKIKIICVFLRTNIDKNNKILINQILQLKLKNNVKLIGKCTYSSIDECYRYIFKESYGEGFPNVAAEAMACKTPCIVTNVGDAVSVVENRLGYSPKKSSSIIKCVKKTFC